MSVLVVERDDELRAIVAEIVGAFGFSVRATAEGDEALALARDAPPKIVLLEVPLLRPSSAELVSAWRAAAPKAWLIATTAHRRVGEPDLDGFDAVLRKPFGLEACERALERAREGSRGRWRGGPESPSAPRARRRQSGGER